MKTLLTTVWAMLLFITAQGQLIDDSGILQTPYCGLDTAKIRQNRIHKVQVTLFRSAQDTLKNEKGESNLQAEFDNQSRLTFLKGCLHEGSDACTQEYDFKISYLPNGLIHNAVFIHFDKGKQFYDSNDCIYDDSSLIKSTERYLYALNASDIDTLRGMTYYHFEKFNLVNKGYFGYINTIYPKVTYQRDSFGRILKQFFYDEKDKLAENYVFYKNKKGIDTLEKLYEGKILTGRIVWKYNKIGLLIEKRTYGADDSLNVLHTYKYNKTNQIVDEYDEPQHQDVGTVCKYIYDKTGKLIEKRQTMANGKKMFRYAYKYNGLGLLIEELYYDSEDDLTLIYRYKYL